MIDEKKIEEAAKVVVEKEYAKDIPIIKGTFKNGFNTGINWFLDNLWHMQAKSLSEIETFCLNMKTGTHQMQE